MAIYLVCTSLSGVQHHFTGAYNNVCAVFALASGPFTNELARHYIVHIHDHFYSESIHTPLQCLVAQRSEQ